MGFDLRPQIIENPAESQTAEGGSNWNDNCSPAAHLMCMSALGYGDPAEPQDITDWIYGPGATNQPEMFQAAVDYILQHGDKFPNPPQIDVTSPGDFAAAIEEAGRQGFPMVGGFHCDQGATIVTWSGPYGHASLPVAHDDASDTWTVWNVWTGFEQTFSRSDLNAAYAGGLTIFHRSITTTHGGNDLGTLDGPQADELNQIFNNTDQLNRRLDDGFKQMLEQVYNQTQWTGNDVNAVKAELNVDALTAAITAKLGSLPAGQAVDVKAVATEVVAQISAKLVAGK